MPDRLFAIGDIHGCFEPLQELVEDKIQLTHSDTLVFLGDYIDRGPKVKAVIDYILELRDQNYRVVTLSGNHEDMLLNALESKHNLPLWFFNGGDKTMQSFGIRSLKNIGPEYLEFFKKLELWHSTETFLFVHAGFNDEISNPFDDEYSMIWKCRNEYNHPQLKDKTIVHGHCITTAQDLKEKMTGNPQVIGIDTGCVYKELRGYGILTALEVYSRQVYHAKCI